MTVFSSASATRLTVVLSVIALAALSLPTASLGQVPTRDSVVGTGSTGVLTNIDFSWTSGPSGENPSGHSSVFFAPTTLTATSIDCLAVNGNTATIAGPTAINPRGPGYAYFKATAVDGHIGDTLAAIPSEVPLDCSTPVLQNVFRFTSGGVVVVDAKPSRMVGKGSVSGGGKVASYAYKISCDAAASASARLLVGFGDQRFRLTGVSSAACTDASAVSTPAAGFDTHSGTGTGTLTTGGPGKVDWEFVDGGPGGANDSLQLEIRDASGAVVFQGSAAPPARFPGSSQATGRNTAR